MNRAAVPVMSMPAEGLGSSSCLMRPGDGSAGVSGSTRDPWRGPVPAAADVYADGAVPKLIRRAYRARRLPGRFPQWTMETSRPASGGRGGQVNHGPGSAG